MKITSGLFVLASLAASTWATTVADVLNQIALVEGKVKDLNAAIDAFPNPGGTLEQGLAIHNKAGPMNQQLITAKDTVVALNTKPVTLAEGRSVLDRLYVLEPYVHEGLTDIQTKKSAFQALPVAGLVLLVCQDLKTLNASTWNFEHEMLLAAPTSLHEEARALGARIDMSFAAALAVYGPC